MHIKRQPILVHTPQTDLDERCQVADDRREDVAVSRPVLPVNGRQAEIVDARHEVYETEQAEHAGSHGHLFRVPPEGVEAQ